MDNYYNAFPILKEFNMIATIFCITSESRWFLLFIKRCNKRNVQNEYRYRKSHCKSPKHLNEMTYDEQLKELTESKTNLRK